MKIFHASKTFSPWLISLLGIFFCQSLRADTKYPVVPNPGIDAPLCYMENPDGTTVDMSAICAKPSTPDKTPQSCPPDSQGAKVSFCHVNYQGNSFTGQVTNHTGKSVRNIKVYYEIMDREGNLIDNGFIYVQPVTIKPGESAFFQGTIAAGSQAKVTHLGWREQ